MYRNVLAGPAAEYIGAQLEQISQNTIFQGSMLVCHWNKKIITDAKEKSQTFSTHYPFSG